MNAKVAYATSLPAAPVAGGAPAGSQSALPTLLEITGATVLPARFSESVVVLIDVQNDYTTRGRLPLANIDEALAATQALLQRARALHVPIIHVQQVNPRGRPIFAEGTEGVDFAPQARPESGEIVVVKHLPSSFSGTELQAHLERLGRRRLIVAGCMTHMCVSTTVRATLDHGYQVTVVADACTTRDLPDGDGGRIPATTVHRVALAELRDRFAMIVKAAAEIAE